MRSFWKRVPVLPAAFCGIGIVLAVTDLFVLLLKRSSTAVHPLEPAIALLLIAIFGALPYVCFRLNERSDRTVCRLRTENLMLLHSIADGACGIDAKRNAIFWNEAAENMTGYSTEDVLGRPIHELLQPTKADNPPRPAEENGLYRAICSEDYRVLPKELFLRKDGTLVPVECRVIPVTEPHTRQILGTVVTFRDITDKKKTEELLAKAERLSVVGQLAAGVAHEIRNPLTALKGFSQLLRTKKETPPDYVDIMLGELERIEFIVNEFLFVANPRIVDFRPKRLAAVLESTLVLMEPEALLYNVEFRFFPAAELPDIWMDEGRLKQVFVHVLKNAIEAMPSGGVVTVALQKDAKEEAIKIRFQDEGVGMDKSRIEKLGEPVYTTKEKGTGLGLMVSIKIIEAHRGHLLIHSKPGIGTTVEITLPAEAPPELTQRFNRA
ncbi:ATP-binding protein [Paenibacillus hamazuiensis]|uniref:ATP-binding protein n=1 Tax=Paenibacillus hamazuiensis TaxID=2936508 RepID=UPI00200DB07A|nr:ATP-binding protein [Paenibacillus hamazuiensis]